MGYNNQRQICTLRYGKQGKYQGGKGRAKEGREGGGHVGEEPERQRKGGKSPGGRGKGQNVPFLSILALPFPPFFSFPGPFLPSVALPLPLRSLSSFPSHFLLPSAPSFFPWPLLSLLGPFFLYLSPFLSSFSPDPFLPPLAPSLPPWPFSLLVPSFPGPSLHSLAPLFPL